MSDPVRTRDPVVEEAEAEAEEVPSGPHLPGFAYPLIAVAFAAVLVWSFSRILLAVDKNQASAIALLMAMNLLIGAALIAYGGRVRRRPAAFPFLLIASLVVIAGGTVAAVAFGDRGAEEAGEGEQPQTQVVTLEATELEFTQTELTLTAGARIRMTFANADSGTQHNFSLFNGPDATAPVIFRGSLNTGPTTVTYDFTAPGRPGDYFFQCDVHPGTMTGTAKVVPAEPGGGGEAGAPTVEARGLQFLQPNVSVPSGGQVAIHFVNSDAGTQHNIAVFRGQDATAPLLFRGELIAGPAEVDYTFEAPPPGTYFFHCDVHPTMTGTLTVS
jgi:plastocyanin